MAGRVSVLGAGNGGCAIAADLARRGMDPTLFDLPAFADVLEPIREAGGLRLTGVLGDAQVPIPRITTAIDEAVGEGDVLVVAVPAFAQATFAAAMAPHLRPGHTIVLAPGSTGGALAVADVLRRAGGLEGVAVAETLSLPFACRKPDPASVHVAGVKQNLPLAAFPARSTADVVARVADVFPGGVAPAAHVLETSLNNMNATAHPVPVVLNAGWIETTGGDFRFYADGVSPSVARVMDAVDADRLRLVAALGLPSVPATEWDRRMYGLTGETTYELNRDSWVHRDIRAPRELRTRYLLEDVPFGLVPIASIARELGIPTPTIDLVVDLASLLADEDLRAHGRTADALGLGGLDAAGMVRLVETGTA
ncbi:MAG: NAD/NADP octopine/nopaline dehydrogenase family protein [Chloroflexi bacterium]|nr:NAD/NADP octopine/nopaline dehydrogenase family protein [Chloroflexota bacterium]